MAETHPSKGSYRRPVPPPGPADTLGYTRSVMPIYEYICRSCSHTFDIVQAMSDESMTVCPECGGELRKVFGAPAISFKGSGFYANDRRDKSKKASEKGAEKSTDAAAAKSQPKSEPKSDKPAETGGSKDAPKPAPEKRPAKSSEPSS